MKTFVLAFVFLTCIAATAQDCKNYFFLQNGKTIEMTIYNKKGEENGKQVYTISDYKSSGGVTSATVNSEIFDKKGKSITKSVSAVQCKAGVMMADLKMSLPQTPQLKDISASTESFFLDYPAKMNVGDALADAHMKMDIDMHNGMKQNVSLDITDRKVEGKESVTTAAGTWDCYKITSHQKTVIKTIGIGIPINIDNTEWFSPGAGIVKTNSKVGGTAITAIR
jgi:hypothetical protein